MVKGLEKEESEADAEDDNTGEDEKYRGAAFRTTATLGERNIFHDLCSKDEDDGNADGIDKDEGDREDVAGNNAGDVFLGGFMAWK